MFRSRAEYMKVWANFDRTAMGSSWLSVLVATFGSEWCRKYITLVKRSCFT